MALLYTKIGIPSSVDIQIFIFWNNQQTGVSFYV
nr:MAG TPA: hypothetical protein [Caudoviricetes sp.]